MKTYQIEGKPITWKRARRCGNRYFDSQSKDKEAFIQRLKTANKVIYCASKPLKVFFEFNIQMPRYLSNRSSVNKILAHDKTPDIDNLCKFVADALNGILWIDDKIIYEMHARKVYAPHNLTRITLDELECAELFPDISFV